MSFAVRKGYAWPASALTSVEMAVLADVREETGKPVSVLLREAVQLAYGGCSPVVGVDVGKTPARQNFQTNKEVKACRK